ncbi:DUF3800 domain-containing protein [Mycolicibacter kumamotonensis]|uniref:DUF3800 domain-containing protein n=1 Tax=Mycolicibacter kumamotonensis TaxID=354243 RepID=A0A1B8S9D2_9MYCO|nr:DUF3800 domain-containing protein [Mycolicibacter kumamotonensis]OBY29276.1 hypothetical protein ACT18_23915 [Mycolicibacter kumamotonensis]
MHLAYIDESHNKDEYWIASLIIPAEDAQRLELALDAVVENAERDFPQLQKFGGKPIELHGHALAQGTDDWTPMENMLRARLGIYEDALRAIAAVEGAAIVRAGIDRNRLKSRYGDRAEHPHEWALKFALERTDEVVKRRNGMVLITCDQTDDPDRHHANLRVFRNYNTGGLMPRRLTRIVDTIHFADSCHSRLVQASDLVSYISFRTRTDTLNQRTGKAAEAAKRLWAILDPLHQTNYLWTP